MRSTRDVLDALPTSAEAGLTAAGVADSRGRFGVNRLTPLPREPVWKKFLEKFDEPIIKILLAAALLSMVVELFNAGPAVGGVALALAVLAPAAALAVPALRGWLPTVVFGTALVLLAIGFTFSADHPPVEGLAVMVAVVLATGVAFLSEYKSDREFEALNAGKEAVQVKAVRGGAVVTVPLDEVVVGDVVVVEPGDEVPADGRLLAANELAVDQALLTGESEPVRKRPQAAADDAHGPEQPGCLYRGTQAVDGSGRLLVCDVGDATMIGQIARRLSDDPDGDGDDRVRRKLSVSKELTPLQLKLQRLAELISKVGYAAAGAIFLALVLQAVLRGDLRLPAGDDFWPVLQKDFGVLLDAFVYMVIIIVVAVPEGLPMSVTVSLALAMRKMTRANSLVRQLVACETVGSATVICSDKTGTLTENRMTVVRLGMDGRVFEPPFDDGVMLMSSATGDWPRPGSPLDWLVLNAAVNSTANLQERDGKTVPVGNTTEGALLLWLDGGAWFQQKGQLDYRGLRRQYPAVYQLQFSSERKSMTTVVRHNGRLVALVKGASEVVLGRSTHFVAADGTAREWTPAGREAVLAQIADAAGSAMRTLGFAYAELPPEATDEAVDDYRDRLGEGLVFAGFAAIRDPVRADVPAAVEQCRKAGIDVTMITGDNVETARAIARDIGLLDRADAVVLTSQEFNDRSDDEVTALLPRLRVLARARPLDKLRMVRLLQAQNHVVAMTGDGTNDAPALKRADVGLAMGVTGTEVAKEASKIVLLDDSFATIVKAVHWGRSLYENIQRFIQFQLTINVSALTIAFLGPFLGVRPPFTVLQLLWINVIMDTFAAIALCSEPPRPGLMAVPPKRKDENILTRAMVRTILLTAGFFVVVMVGLLLGMEYAGWFAAAGTFPKGDWEFAPLTARQVTIFFTTYVLFQVWNQINCRSLTPKVSGLRGLGKNPAFLGIAAAILVGQALIVTFGGSVFKVEPLAVADWLVIAAATASVLAFAEVARRVRLAVRSG